VNTPRITDEDEPDKASEGAVRGAARVVGAAQQRPLGKSYLAAVEPAGEVLLDAGDQLHERT
jgi:hypothetical protein